MKQTVITMLSALIITTHAAAAQETSPPASQSAASSTPGNVAFNADGSFQLAQARNYIDVLTALEAEGYVLQDIKTTFLGRIMIKVQNTAHLREVVVSRSTGEIMSDVILEVFAQGSSDATTQDEEAANGIGAKATVETDLNIGMTGGNNGSNLGAVGGAGISLGLGN